jgi:hypothetical protein
MSSEWTDWLNQLALDKKGPVRFSAATRGLPWASVVQFPGNVTTATLEMEVRAAPNSPTKLLDVTVGTPAFADGLTTWVISLTGSQTNGLPTTENGVAEFPVDAVLTLSGGIAERLFGGVLPVSGFITVPGA